MPQLSLTCEEICAHSMFLMHLKTISHIVAIDNMTSHYNVIDTTGLQSSIAVMELNGSITVTCTFATGATSTGCQVTIFTMGNIQEVYSTNITRPDGASQVGNVE